MATPTVKRTTELTELEWEALERDAGRLGVRSWRSMLRGIARGELVVVDPRQAPELTHVRGQTDTSADKHWEDDPQ